MKKIATLAVALTIGANAAFAGGYAEPVVEPEPVVVEENTSSSSHAGLIVPALLLLGVIAAASSGS